MENTQNQQKQENQNQNQNIFPITLNGPSGIPKNQISYLTNLNSELPQDEQTKNNLFIQKRNRVDDKIGENINNLEINIDLENKTGEMNNDSISDINMKSPHPQKNKIYQMNQLNSHDQFICKKMSIDLDDDITNSNIVNKKLMGCNCKNSGCLKRYCECFSRMKYCDGNCQCKNCLNNIKYEKERAEAIRIYLVKSPVSFKKINMDLNNVTCNCKKSNCLKNYCECFQFGLKCTYNCGCVDCKNRNLFEKKLFFVENNCDSKKSNNNTSNIQKNSINNNNNLIKLQEEETNINNINNKSISKEKKSNESSGKKILGTLGKLKALSNSLILNKKSDKKKKTQIKK